MVCGFLGFCRINYYNNIIIIYFVRDKGSFDVIINTSRLQLSAEKCSAVAVVTGMEGGRQEVIKVYTSIIIIIIINL